MPGCTSGPHDLPFQGSPLHGCGQRCIHSSFVSRRTFFCPHRVLLIDWIARDTSFAYSLHQSRFSSSREQTHVTVCTRSRHEQLQDIHGREVGTVKWSSVRGSTERSSPSLASSRVHGRHAHAGNQNTPVPPVRGSCQICGPILVRG